MQGRRGNGRKLLWLSAGVVLALMAASFLFRSTPQEVRFSEGTVIRIEAVTYGTKHIVGISSPWIRPFRRLLPPFLVKTLTPRRLQTVHVTERPSLVIWTYECSPDNLPGGFEPRLVDENGDAYHWDGIGRTITAPTGFSRRAHEFPVFPRRESRLKCEFFESGYRASLGIPSRTASNEIRSLWIKNPAPRPEIPICRPESLPATRQVGPLKFFLESVRIRATCYPRDKVRFWEPVFEVTQDGHALENWQRPDWEAEDPDGNRGQRLGLHAPALKFIISTWPRPETVLDPTNRWRLPFVRVPTAAPGIQWNITRSVGGVTVTLVGLCPPGFDFPSVPLGLAEHRHVVFVRRVLQTPQQKLALGVWDEKGKITWGQAATLDECPGMDSFIFEPPLSMERAAVEIVLLNPTQADFVVRP